ncbi:hypothetical protein MED222_05260 [Vibrio sp. MED222]|nr:hypothetical protein MED222_05260 [Vibrio sp. MED222]
MTDFRHYLPVIESDKGLLAVTRHS